ncbi:serine/threonine-protein phosphatase 4 regulatory subunit 2-A isoform X1 [Oryzias latipes]|uniref:serine/threonine-protein phosphatase 4 regulatory subunit 2-A isoform X1 n=1 Tax=Oryzias latipes TaxID=8090 RepID=UPI000CE25C70|nr:serine/threonine-protein phosphatase 4 regulatory subunit 2-A isoform X1 [Oryzias latipes]
MYCLLATLRTLFGNVAYQEEQLPYFEKKGKEEVCPLLEQFLCHVAKTGQPLIPWSQFKMYFMFKLEKVISDFHDSSPEQRTLRNPNVDYVPFEEMKRRILKIVDGYSGVPFTIQRLCELLTDPKRNYTSTDKFLRGLEKNVMVVSCLFPTSDRNVNGPSTPKTHNRPKLSLSTSLSTNGLPDCSVSKEPQSATEMEEHHTSDASSPEKDTTLKAGLKSKNPPPEEDSGQLAAKRLKIDVNQEKEAASEENDSLCHNGSESSSESQDSSERSSEECKGESAHGTPSTLGALCTEPSSKTESSEEAGDLSEEGAEHSVLSDSSEDQSEHSTPTAPTASFEERSEESSSSSDGEGLTSVKQVSSTSTSPDLSTEGSADTSESPKTATEPEEQH